MSEETVITPSLFTRVSKGHRFNELFEIDHLVATGGMGEVYRGHTITTGDQVAIKTIRPEFAENESALALFKKEASALRDLHHEAIVRYFVFSIDKGLPYLAMEFVEGKSLSDVLRGGPLPLDQVFILQKRIASGLQAAHEIGIIHRDISPDNIILPGGNVARAKIIDFGIARSTQSEGTVIGSGFAGKFGYVSPEQVGLHGGDVTGQSDIYSLGLVLAETALGRPIEMGGTHFEVIEKRRQVPDLSGLEAPLVPLITAMLQPDPKNRIASMAEVATWVPKEVKGGRKAGTGGGAAGGQMATSRKPVWIAAAAMLLAAIGAAGYSVAPRLGSSDGGSIAEKPAEAALLPNAPSAKPELALLPEPGQPQPAGKADTTRRQELPSSSSAASRPEPVIPEPGLPSPAVLPAPSAPASTTPDAPAPTTSPNAGGNPAVVASLPNSRRPGELPRPETRPVPPGMRASVDQIRDYLLEYDGGECFFVTPTQVAANSAKIEGFGQSAAPFVTFDEAFKRQLGFEPDISLRTVSPEQCPVVDYMARRTVSASRPPTLTLASDRIRSGQDIVGTAESRDPHLEILLVADDGLVHNLGPYASRTGNTVSFKARVEAQGGSERPQLVVAVSSTQPIQALPKREAVRAEQLFKQLLRGPSDMHMVVKYIKLGG